MLFELYEWWIGQLSDCIPKRWRRTGSPIQDGLMISPVESVGPDLKAVSVSVWAKSRETPLGEFLVAGHDLADAVRPYRLPVVLRLADSDVLGKTITLPLAAERDLAQVLAFEMDRETPFVADEVFWAYRIVERDKQRGQLAARLRLISRTVLAPLLASLAEAGILVRRAEISGGADDGLYLPLETDGTQSKHRTGTRRLRWASASICIVLGVLAIAFPFVRQARGIARLDREIAAGRESAGQAERLRHEIERLDSAGNVLKSERAAAGDPLAMLAALTTALPDDTYLTELQQQQHKVTFGGRSATASRLIGAISNSKELHNPVFAAPVTRMEATHTEVFSINAETGP